MTVHLAGKGKTTLVVQYLDADEETVQEDHFPDCIHYASVDVLRIYHKDDQVNDIAGFAKGVWRRWWYELQETNRPKEDA